MWTPRWHHVTQIHEDGSGWNDCAEASLARAVMEYDPTTPARMENTEWELVRKVHDPNDPATIWDLVSRMGMLARGMPDTPGQGFTSGDGIWAILNAFGLGADTTYVDQEDGSSRAYDAAYARAMSLCWVDGIGLAPASFPPSYFAGDSGWDHLILWLPNSEGRDNLFNDPLSVAPDTKTDVQYDLSSIRSAMGGVWLLPTPEAVTEPVWTVKDVCGLKFNPNHICKAITNLRAGEVVKPMSGETPHWKQITVSGHIGWVLKDNLTES